MEWSFRPMEVGDLPGLLVLQERGAVAALGKVFPQETYPFPRDAVRERWESELASQDMTSYVATAPDGRLVGFAARWEDEVMHFGTALETWGSGLATWLHDELVATYAPEVTQLRLRVFEGNTRARRFYERLGWMATGEESRTSFPPHPTLLAYVLDRADRHAARCGA
ncbi:GNAT family N-acetyltransferase [Nocardioides sp. InS609-2]|uniref:GNAT family N-acetyltransferase n=1 Tax=Nocardioides sp. InS609-2 TaxID=2760705 RepID=UPI0020BF6C33|nr:GNAT family N-acetyltransferase [Nocardioides sp. InS609-2]